MITFLQVSASLVFFIQKVLVLMGKKSGWLVGVIAATLALFYFYHIDLYVYTALEVGLIVLMGYGFFKQDSRNPTVETYIRLVTSVIMLALAICAFSGVMTVVELFSSLGLLMGTYLLTHNHPKLGWFCYTIGHILGAILGYSKGQQFFADFQIASAIVSAVGMFKIQNKE